MSIVKSTEDKLKLKIMNTSHNYAQAFQYYGWGWAGWN
jgi:hypothetical protein